MSKLDNAMLEFLMPTIEKMVEEKIRAFMESNETEPIFTINDELPITTEILAERMGLSKSFLYQEVRNGNIPYHKRCKRLYFIPSEIKDWITGKWKRPPR
ncbi:MAG: helix-turn-helix domain-containing protein [Ferruginibacter sp.]|nr:helix-turn-helix domain-containing protein [Ferruginibacter sp.]